MGLNSLICRYLSRLVLLRWVTVLVLGSAVLPNKESDRAGKEPTYHHLV